MHRVTPHGAVPLHPRNSGTIEFNVTAITVATYDEGGDLVATPGAYTLIFDDGANNVTMGATVVGQPVVVDPFPPSKQ